MIKFHVVGEAIQRSSSLPFITNLACEQALCLGKNSEETPLDLRPVHRLYQLYFVVVVVFNVNAKTSTGYSTYFKDVIQYYYIFSIQSGVRLIEVFNNRN